MQSLQETPPKPTRTPVGPVEWLREFAVAVRTRDFSSGRRLCSNNIVAFGTVSFRTDNLDELLLQQWQPVWNSTRGFDFDYESVNLELQDNLAVVMATWHSIGTCPNGSEFNRRGRATIILKRNENQWHAFHTHFSMQPHSSS
jgi:ketosteroid isomerase-like protein